MFETYGVYILAVGAVLSVLGYLWLLVRAWRVDWRWAVGILLVPLVLPVFVFMKFRHAALPTLLLLLGVAMAGGTVGVNLYLAHHIDLGPREKIVDGERHITLTGWDNPPEDYVLLETKPDTVVLQMANSDVTDATLEYLVGLSELKELDLNDTQITDDALALIAQLPRLRLLRLRGTKVTDEGFQQHLMNKDTLRELDVRETGIASKTLRKWKSTQKEVRRVLK